MTIPSLEFLLALCALVAVFHASSSTAWRRGVLTCCSFAFVWWTLPDGWSRVAIGAFALSGYAAARVLRARPLTFLFMLYVLGLVAVFAVLKKYEFIGVVLPAPLMNHPIAAVGLSYMLFRQIHFVVDAMQQQIPEFTLASYLNYQFNLFGFISGPIQRYQDFQKFWQDARPLLPDRHGALRAYLRVFVGMIKVSVISLYFLKHFNGQRAWFLHPGDLATLSRGQLVERFAVVLYAYPLFLYFNFSGYCDVAIAGAALVGIRLPENFDRPYLSRNVSDYWTRFHQSLGFWIRDYLFTPTYKSLATRWSDQAQWLVYPCYLVAFVLAGVWHGNSMNFFVFGLLHGLGVCAGKVWENHLLKQGGRKRLKAYLASGPIRLAAIFLTLNFVALTMLFFPGTVAMAWAILRNFTHGLMRHA